MSDRWDKFSMRELIGIHQELERTLHRRFAVDRALVFTDVVGSVAFFRKHGDAIGHGLQQRHLVALKQALKSHRGQLVDTAGDGGFSWFATPLAAVSAAIELQRIVIQENQGVAREHELVLRIGIHFGQVLQDDNVVTGDSVNLCARLVEHAAAGEVVLTRDVFFQLANDLRLLCHPLEPALLKGFVDPVGLYRLDWRGQPTFPDRVRIEETEQVYKLDPNKELITFGRLRTQGGQPANDIVLRLPDDSQTKMISRWHFQLERGDAGYLLRPVSPAATEVNGEPIPMNTEAPVFPGACVRLSKVLTLRFLGPGRENDDSEADHHDSDDTLIVTAEELAEVRASNKKSPG